MELGRGSRVRPEARRATARSPARLAWITGLRLVFLTLLLGATAIFYLRGELARYPFSLRIVFVTIAAALRARRPSTPSRLRAGRRLPRARVRADRARPAHLDGDRLRHRRRDERGHVVLRAHLPRSARCSSGSAGPPSRRGQRHRDLRDALLRRFASRWIQPPLDQAERYALDASAARLPAPRQRARHHRRRAPRAATSPSASASPAARSQAATQRALRGRAARASSGASPPGSRTRSATRSVRSPARSRCSASRRRSRTKTGELCDIVQREARAAERPRDDMLDLSKPRRPAHRGDRRRGARA